MNSSVEDYSHLRSSHIEDPHQRSVSRGSLGPESRTDRLKQHVQEAKAQIERY